MTHPRYIVTSNVRTRRTTTPARTVILTSTHEDGRQDRLVLTCPEDEARRYREGAQYFVEVWPVAKAEQIHPAPAGSPASTTE